MSRTKVVFRKWPSGDVIALFPFEPGTNDARTCNSYEHMGQHGSASPLLVYQTRRAVPSEYEKLQNELIGLGYDLQVIARIPANAQAERARKIVLSRLDEFTRAYITAALWSTYDESTPQGGEPMDSNYSIEDIAESTLQSIIVDCKAFQTAYGHLFTDDNCNYHGCSAEEYAGHDFWLTRNGHGAGFWDGGWVEPIGEQLTKACKQYSEVDLYVGDDGLIHA